MSESSRYFGFTDLMVDFGFVLPFYTIRVLRSVRDVPRCSGPSIRSKSFREILQVVPSAAAVAFRRTRLGDRREPRTTLNRRVLCRRQSEWNSAAVSPARTIIAERSWPLNSIIAENNGPPAPRRSPGEKSVLSRELVRKSAPSRGLLIPRFPSISRVSRGVPFRRTSAREVKKLSFPCHRPT